MLISNNAKNAMLIGLDFALDSGVATLNLYGINNDLLVSMPMPSPISSSILASKLTFDTINQSLVINSGTPVKAILSVGSAPFLEFAVGTDLILDKPTVQAGGNLKINELSLTI